MDKALHSAGIDSGFIIFGANLSNPLNMLLPLLQTVSEKKKNQSFYTVANTLSNYYGDKPVNAQYMLVLSVNLAFYLHLTSTLICCSKNYCIDVLLNSFKLCII